MKKIFCELENQNFEITYYFVRDCEFVWKISLKLHFHIQLSVGRVVGDLLINLDNHWVPR